MKRTAQDNGMDALRKEEAPVLIVSVAKTGHVNQCLAVCEFMQWNVAAKILIPGSSAMDSSWRRAHVSFLRWCHRKWHSASKSGDQIRIVASGSVSEKTVQEYRRLYGAGLFAVYVGAPRKRNQIFDIAIASHHSVTSDQVRTPGYFPGAKATLWIPGVLTRNALHSFDGERSSRALVMIGGINKSFRVEPSPIIHQLKLLQMEGALTIAFSRRTPKSLESQVRAALKSSDALFIGREDRVAFVNAFRSAKEYYVTPDSITMICEACASKRSVTIFALECFDSDTSTSRFVSEFLRAGYIKSFEDRKSALLVRLPIPDFALEEVSRSYNIWSR